ncbi:MAG: lipopolysaccharide heptosyltransferase I [Candidatus Parabeggiatoa sp. nov. 2]|nr:MAG: lipopolysaccharide heptosyltransferase I [Gammaproteobacteria bacterium]
MYILIVKTSSLGDVIHTLPALTDALKHYPDLQCDWVVEEAFAEIPAWHPAVKRVIPVALRRWRKQPWQTWRSGRWRKFIQTLTCERYDRVIDAQGLIKSAFLTLKARGPRCGLDRHSAREPLAALAYQQRYAIDKNQHAVTRVRQLFAAVLDYPLPDSPPDYGIVSHFQCQQTRQKIFYSSKPEIYPKSGPAPRNARPTIISKSGHAPRNARPTIIFLHGTTWVTKHWPNSYWLALAQRVTAAGLAVRLPWGNAQEYARAQQIAAAHPNISLIPKSNLHGIATELAQAQAVVGVDTGLAHLAAALAVPSITLYGATQPARTGTYGQQQQHLQANFPCAPCLRKKCAYRGLSTVSPACYEDLSVDKVWGALQALVY